MMETTQMEMDATALAVRLKVDLLVQLWDRLVSLCVGMGRLLQERNVMMEMT